MFRKVLATTCFAVGLASLAPAAFAAECGDVVIANMDWQSIDVLANIDKIILENGYGCSAEITMGDTVSIMTSMVEKGEPDIAPEAWLNALPDIVSRGVAEGKLVSAGNALSDGGMQGWYIPKYIADAHPDIKKVSDALKHPELFPAPEDNSKGAVFNGPAGWGASTATSQLYKAYEGDAKGFVLVDPGSAAGLDGSIAKNYERQIGWLGYYWSPSSVLGKYLMVKLDSDTPHDAAEWKRCITVADCEDPKVNAWPSDKVETLVTGEFAERAGVAMDYLKSRRWDNATVNEVLAWMTENQATGEEAARYFLNNKPEIWTKWLSPEVADKVKASL
ncbi:glycine betaine ABC transporter substrate-binding protein [Ensifer aridi]|uniref:glycine betaine ABC transporter substrate-binding protein n=1 Tax=Ensifer aridi TaxID=1708715 RepID=UPI0009BF2B65|nr:glycine betaine ABC transporter substrate-binding protein [Ensifer aridi]